MDVLGLDFGTSNTVAVLASDGRPPRVVAIDGIGWLPSGVFVENDGALTVGREAERRARSAPERYEPHPKRRIDEGELLLGVRVVPVVDAIAAVLRRVAEEVRRQLNGKAPDAVHLTHPAAWGSTRTQILRTAAQQAGLGERIVLVPEPVAAATHFASLPGHRPTPGSALAVYDLGGGTLDVAVVAVQAGPGGQPQYVVAAESGLNDLGGVDFDQVVLDHLGRSVSSSDPARWQAVVRPRTAGDRRAALTLREDGRAAKETLSRLAQTDVPLPDPFEDTLLTRQEFDGLIRPLVLRSVDTLAETIKAAGRTPDALLGIYLVGGSSRIPLIASSIGDRLGIVPITLDQPETSVAMGAALAPAGRPAGAAPMVPPVAAQPRPQPGSPQGPGTGSGPAVPPRHPATGPSPQQQRPASGSSPQAPRPTTGSSPQVPRPAAARPTPQVGQPAAPAARAKRPNAIWAAVAAVVLLAGVLITIIVVNSSGNSAVTTTSTPPTVPTAETSVPGTTGSDDTSAAPATSGPATTPTPNPTARSSPRCSAPNDRGFTDCMTNTIGSLNSGLCITDLTAIEEKDIRDVIEAEAVTWNICYDAATGSNAAMVSVQFPNITGYNQLFDLVTDRMAVDEIGTTMVEGQEIEYIAGLFRSDAGKYEGAVLWADNDNPVLNFATGLTDTDSTWEEIRDYVSEGLGTEFVPNPETTTTE